jgi:V/A-type H+/Na+-transporting ATPase subunit D
MRTADIKPTRSELLTVKRRIKLTERAYTLLKRKQDGLMLELVKVIKETKQLRHELVERYTASQQMIAVAYMMVGTTGVAIATESIERVPTIERSQKNILGVSTPIYTEHGVKKNLDERGYCILGTDSVIDDVAGAFEDLLSIVILAAASQTELRLVLDELVRTRRRVRALEYRVLPEMKEKRNYIQLRRDEMDREEASRLFHIKKVKVQRDSVKR